MTKKICLLTLVLTLLVSSVAVAEVTNRDMQLMGGVVVSNATDSFFFAPMEEGVTNHWGLYALSKAASGPIVTITSGYPARLVQASDTTVYFFGYSDADRTVHELYSVDIATGTANSTPLLTDVASAFVGDDDNTFLYVTKADPYTLHSYDLSAQKSTKIKDMSGSKKKIYDAIVYKGKTYFVTKTDSGSEDAYEYHPESGKATNLDVPSPKALTSVLYEGYRLYGTDAQATRVYAMKLGSKSSTQISQKYPISLGSPRFGEAIYVYDGDGNRIIRYPLDGSAESSIQPDDGNVLTRMVMGGNQDELLLLTATSVCSVRPDLSSQTKLFDFTIGGQMWNYVVPAGNNILVMGYGPETLTHASNMMPTGVYAFDRSGNLLFGYPSYDPEAESATAANDGQVHLPEGLGSVPVDEHEEGETYFVF